MESADATICRRLTIATDRNDRKRRRETGTVKGASHAHTYVSSERPCLLRIGHVVHTMVYESLREAARGTPPRIKKCGGFSNDQLAEGQTLKLESAYVNRHISEVGAAFSHGVFSDTVEASASVG